MAGLITANPTNLTLLTFVNLTISTEILHKITRVALSEERGLCLIAESSFGAIELAHKSPIGTEQKPFGIGAIEQWVDTYEP